MTAGAFAYTTRVRARVLAVIFALALAGCASPRAPVEPLPVEIGALEARPPSAVPLPPDALVARVASAVVLVRVPPRGVRPFPEYARGVGLGFLHMLAQPLTAPVFLYDLFLGWLDLDTTYGTGFIVTSRGHAVTNAHVVMDSEWVLVERPDGAAARA